MGDRITGTAFFPGGAGLWGVTKDAELPSFPERGVMVLGHDFHSEDAFRQSLEKGTEVPGNPTWRNLLELLQDAEIKPEQCFFTNCYMGLRCGRGTTGRFPGSADAGFVNRCRSFLLRQISIQRPQVILTLGVWVPPFIAPLSQHLEQWAAASSLTAMDEIGPVVREVVFRELDDHTCSVAALTHPSLRPANVRRRRFNALAGYSAELAIVRAAMKSSM